jgi:hypothetical protein
VYVALDADGRPTPAPKWEPSTPEDEALQTHAMRLMALGHEIQDELQVLMSRP